MSVLGNSVSVRELQVRLNARDYARDCYAGLFFSIEQHSPSPSRRHGSAPSEV